MLFLRSIQLADTEINLEWGDGEEGDPSLERQLLDMCKLHYDIPPKEALVTVRIHKLNKARTLFLPPQPLSVEPVNTVQVVLFIVGSPHQTGALRVFRRNIDTELLPVELASTSRAMLIEVQAFAPTLYYALDGGEVDGGGATSLLVALFNVTGRRHEVLDYSLPDAVSSSLLREAQDKFIESSFTQFPLPALLTDALCQNLREVPSTSWHLVGPYDYRHWHECPLELACLDGGSALKGLGNLLLSDTFRTWIGHLSGLELGGLQEISLRRVTRRCFQIFNEQYEEPSGLEVVLSVMATEVTDASHDNGGSWIYLVEGEKVAEIPPQHKILSMAYRVEGCNRFLSYVPGDSALCLYQFHLLFRVIEDDPSEGTNEG